MDKPDKKIIENVINCTATKEQARQVVEWFSTTAEGQLYLSDLINQDAQMLEKEDLSNYVSIDKSRDILYQINRQIKQKKIFRFWMRVAAVLLPLILLSGLMYYTNSKVDLFGETTYTEIYVPKGDQQHIIFQDGSEVYLNSDTKLTYPTKFGLTSRKLFLNGEGYFKVTKNKNRPFIVQLNNANVTVLGTQFNVKAYDEDSEMRIVLDRGSILFNIPQDSYHLSPGQEAVYDKATGKCTIYTLSESKNASAWKEKMLVFNDTPLSEVLRTLNRKFNVKFSVQNKTALTYSYTLTTSQTSLEKIVEELEKITPVRFSIQNDSVNVYLK